MSDAPRHLISKLLCLFCRRHDYRIRGASGRVFLQCSYCGARSPGWETGFPAGPAPVRAPSDLRLLIDDETDVMPPLSKAPDTLPYWFPVTDPGEFRLHLDA